jgi:multidrug resistance efflux pump
VPRPSEPTVRTPWNQRVDDFKRRSLPLIVWSAAVLAVVFLLSTRVQEFEYIGLAEALQYEVSSSSTGTLDHVLVDLYDDVEPGDVVAKLDDRALAASIETSSAAVRQLRAEFEATSAQVLSRKNLDQASWTADLRRFQIDEESRRLQILDLRARINSDEIELERQSLAVARMQPLVESGVISQNEFDNAKLSRDSLRKLVDENNILLAQGESEYQTARARRLEFERELPSIPGHDSLLAPLREAITVESNRLAEIEIARRGLTLRSPVRGKVSQVLCRRGQSVVPGEPILMISEGRVSQIVAYLGEVESEVRVDTPVLVSSRLGGDGAAESVVTNVSPSIEMLPQRLWRDPRFPDYGRPVMIATVPGLELIPGEVVDIRFLSARD